MTKQQMTSLFNGLQPQANSGHSMLFMIEEGSIADEVCYTLTEEGVKFTCELVDNSCYIIEAQTED